MLNSAYKYLLINFVCNLFFFFWYTHYTVHSTQCYFIFYLSCLTLIHISYRCGLLLYKLFKYFLQGNFILSIYVTTNMCMMYKTIQTFKCNNIYYIIDLWDICINQINTIWVILTWLYIPKITHLSIIQIL